MDLALGLSNGVAVQIALRFDLERRVFERVENARMRGSTLPKDDSVALALNPQCFARSRRGSPSRVGRRSRAFGRWHHPLFRRSAERLHVGKGSFEGLPIPLRGPVGAAPLAAAFASFASRSSHRLPIMNRHWPPGQFAQALRLSAPRRRFFASSQTDPRKFRSFWVPALAQPLQVLEGDGRQSPALERCVGSAEVVGFSSACESLRRIPRCARPVARG